MTDAVIDALEAARLRAGAAFGEATEAARLAALAEDDDGCRQIGMAAEALATGGRLLGVAMTARRERLARAAHDLEAMAAAGLRPFGHDAGPA